ncbi:SDR family NAD(P)-dependent oxidoreductase [Streptomyces sp. CA-111067]|uniref:SDR family NAD(P)-dependent oxidoreductase n=1 Tax=Streptomyces sp. CA-111067 TaxID=3240046 RepID=UPI003D957869
MLDDHPLAGRTALVTGAGRGIGRATALALAGAGADLVLLARSADQLAAVAGEIRDLGRTAHPIRADLEDPRGVRSAGDEVLDVSGGVDILVNNAARVAPLGGTARLDQDDILDALVLNVLSAVALTSALLPVMVRRGWGRIVNVSSGIVARPEGMVGGNVYVTTKAALEAHTVNLAAELDGTGVTANVYRPGTVDTAMQEWIRDQDPERIGEALHQRFVSSHAEGRLITPERSAAVLLERLLGDGTGRIWDVAAAPGATGDPARSR